MARYQYPNPLDLMFFAADAAAKRMGLPTIYIHAFLDLRGQLDVEAFRRTLTALCRVYPAVAARCELSLLTGRPRWRLDACLPDLAHALQVDPVQPATETQLHRQVEHLCATRIPAVDAPPVRFHVFRGLPRGDVLLMRWPHALMDARGGILLLEEIDRLYQEAPDPNTLTSAGDERRDDFAQMVAKVPAGRRAKIILDWLTASKARQARAAQLPQDPTPVRPTRMRYLLRHLTPEQSRQVGDNALRICGFGRFGDFLRAGAIGALHRLMRKPLGPEALYTTLNLINNRKRRQRGPVCWNLTGALPLIVPARLAENRARTADLIREQMLDHLAAETALRSFVTLAMLMRAPTAAAAAAIYAGWIPRKRRPTGSNLAPSPSLPLGLIGPFSRPMPTFCGVELANYYGFATPRPQPGYAVDVNTTEDRINISGVCYESRVPVETLAELLDEFITALLDPS